MPRKIMKLAFKGAGPPPAVSLSRQTAAAMETKQSWRTGTFVPLDWSSAPRFSQDYFSARTACQDNLMCSTSNQIPTGFGEVNDLPPLFPSPSRDLSAAQESYGSSKTVPCTGQAIPPTFSENSILYPCRDFTPARGTACLGAIEPRQTSESFPVEGWASDSPQTADISSLLGVKTLNVSGSHFAKDISRNKSAKSAGARIAGFEGKR
jgi:hypothetical protein